MRTLFLITPFLLGSAPALAQTDPAILKALQDLRNELKATNQRLDRIEGREPQPAGRPSTPPVRVGTSAPVRPQGQPGWQIYLEPWTEDGKGFAVSSFPGPLNDFSFDLHSRYHQSQNRFIYHGVSTFHPKEYGDYIFIVTLSPVLVPNPQDLHSSQRFNCSIEFRINGNAIITAATQYPNVFNRPEKPKWDRQDYYGHITLEAPKNAQGYQVEYRVDCWPEQFKKTTYFDFLLNFWKLNRFEVRVKSPGDMAPRGYQPDELYYVAKQ